MTNVAILGFGTVGSGVYEVIRQNGKNIQKRACCPVNVKYICDIRDFSNHPDAPLFVKDINIVLQDESVNVVVETIGGLKPAYMFVKQSLESGKSVVTSNKELVATHGSELLQIARNNNVCFLFEASVGGGIPVVGPLHQCLSANVINGAMGIVNGTTNFMLTKMASENMSFDSALKVAQNLGYAETTDPSADVDGLDAQRKIAILASIITGSEVHPQNIPTRGIRSVSVEDMQTAKSLDCSVKLIAWANINENEELSCGVEPCLIPCSNQLASVSDVFNAVMINADMLGDVMFYGKGAGKLATASAVVNDIIDATKFGTQLHDSLFWEPSTPIEGKFVNTNTYNYYVRLSNASFALVNEVFENANIVKEDANSIIFIATQKTSSQIDECVENALKKGAQLGIVLKIVANNEQ